jgi:GNAT superfamily N-acetyltransferase
MPLHFTQPDGDDVGALQAVDKGIGEFNAREPALADVRALHVFVRDDLNAVTGGAVGRTWGACCELLQLWVREDQRGSGLGRALMQRFEAAAGERGCTLVYLETWSFQAPGFYAKLGYRPVLATRGYSGGCTRYTMHKTLGAGAPQTAQPAQGDTP